MRWDAPYAEDEDEDEDYGYCEGYYREGYYRLAIAVIHKVILDAQLKPEHYKDDSLRQKAEFYRQDAYTWLQEVQSLRECNARKR